MHTAGFAAVGLPYRYVAIDVPEGQVGAALEELLRRGYIGANVTMPHKREALEWVSQFSSPDYPDIRAVNTVHFRDRAGFNTDAPALFECLQGLDIGPGTRCLLLGGGGAAEAAAWALSKLGAKVCIWNRTTARAKALAELVGANAVSEARADGYHLILNATSAGKTGQALPIDWSNASPDAIAYDLFYSSEPSAFLRQALTKGLAIEDGVSLLVKQGAKSWKCWGIDMPAPLNQMEKTVRECLAG